MRLLIIIVLLAMAIAKGLFTVATSDDPGEPEQVAMCAEWTLENGRKVVVPTSNHRDYNRMAKSIGRHSDREVRCYGRHNVSM